MAPCSTTHKPNKMATKKRKADEISEDSEDVDLHLPAPVWGHVLDYMPYGEVRSALLVGKQIAMEAVKYVRVLNVMTAKEMHVPAARRFANVEEVKILGFIRDPEESDFEDDGVNPKPLRMSSDVANRAATFLSSFPKLKNAFIGGCLIKRYGRSLRTYDPFYPSDPDNHEEIMCRLAESVCGAFKTGALSQDVRLKGIIGKVLRYARACKNQRVANQDHPCSFCLDIVKFYPIHMVCDMDWPVRCYCLSNEEFWNIIARRPGGRKLMKEASKDFLLHWLGRHANASSEYIDVDMFDPEIQNLPHIRRLGRSVKFSFLPERCFEELDSLIRIGLDPTQVTTRDFLRFFTNAFDEQIQFIHNENTPTNVISLYSRHWRRETVEKLASRFVAIDCECIPIIENLNEYI